MKFSFLSYLRNIRNVSSDPKMTYKSIHQILLFCTCFILFFCDGSALLLFSRNTAALLLHLVSIMFKIKSELCIDLIAQPRCQFKFVLFVILLTFQI